MDSGNVSIDTVNLPDKVTRANKSDTSSEEFRKYWSQFELQKGISALKKQMEIAIG
jgi:hypothetical protein